MQRYLVGKKTLLKVLHLKAERSFDSGMEKFTEDYSVERFLPGLEETETA